MWPSRTWMIRMSAPPSRRWVAKLWRSVNTVTRLSMPAAAHAERQAEYRTWTSRGLVSCRPGNNQIRGRQLPIDPQDREQLRRQHDVALLATLAMLDADEAAFAINVADLELDSFRGAQPRRISCRQCGAGPQARDRFRKPSFTMPKSDFSVSCISGYGSSPSRRGPCPKGAWSIRRSSGSRTRSFHTCQGLRPRRARRMLAIAHPPASPSAQLTTRDNTLSRLNGPTLRLHPRGCLRTARGRCGSLRLHRNGLAPSTPCRSPGAPTVMLACSSLCYDRFISPDKLRPWQTWETLCPFWHRSVLVPELGVHRCDAKNGEL